MATHLRQILPALSIFALMACEQAPDNSAPADKRAEGEVLGGSISDEMIPLERLRSQSPPLRAEPATGPGQASSEANSAGEAEEIEPESEPPTVPAAMATDEG